MIGLVIWGSFIPLRLLSKAEVDYLNSAPKQLPAIEWIFYEMNSVWNDLNLDNHGSVSNDEFRSFYSHPVWLLNGIFSASDPTSRSHRVAIAQFLKVRNLHNIADYGGGYGELARIICYELGGANVDIIEPFPSKVSIFRLEEEPRISFVSVLGYKKYEAIVVQDVLEHVMDPVLLAYEISGTVCKGGFLIFANCFYPVIECHLPRTFHLRFTFRYVMRALGLRYIGNIPGAEHIQVFQKIEGLSLSKARFIEKISVLLGSVANRIVSGLLILRYWR